MPPDFSGGGGCCGRNRVLSIAGFMVVIDNAVHSAGRRCILWFCYRIEMGTARIHSNAVPIFYNISAKADICGSGKALLLVQIIGFADYYIDWLPPFCKKAISSFLRIRHACPMRNPTRLLLFSSLYIVLICTFKISATSAGVKIFAYLFQIVFYHVTIHDFFSSPMCAK